MPQFDPAVWVPQLIWLGITFMALYLLMSRVALPRVSEVLEEREVRINESLRKAERLRLNAEDAIASYEKTIADVRAKAAEEVRAAREEAAAEAAERNAQLNERLVAQISAAEQRINKAREAAIAGLRDVAVTVSGAALERLIGQQVDERSLTSSVDTVLREYR
jgi:F-type H+-transporting ATPase subunit b